LKLINKYLRLFVPYLGIALIALAMTLGVFYNWRGKAVLLTTDKTNVFITKKNEIKITPFALTLKEFNVTYYDSGQAKSYEAIIEVIESSDIKVHGLRFKVQKIITLSVNHPYKMAFGQDLYLLSYNILQPENEPVCVVELVHDPFQGVFLAGIILLMVGVLGWIKK
jgi:cytochrome c biogenesis protein ResB